MLHGILCFMHAEGLVLLKRLHWFLMRQQRGPASSCSLLSWVKLALLAITVFREAFGVLPVTASFPC